MPTIKSVEKGLWDCRWWHEGKQYHRRIKAASKAAVLKVISAEIERKEQEAKSFSGGIVWSEGFDKYSTAKLRSGKNPLSMEDVASSVKKLLKKIDDKRVDETNRKEFAEFLDTMADESSPANANKHRRNLLAVARWLRKQGIIEQIPFEYTPSIEAKKVVRKPLPRENRDEYITVLPDWLQPPILFSLATSARNSAICGLRQSDISDSEVVLHEKLGKVRRLLRDEVIDGIIKMAEKQRKVLHATTDRVFCNSKGGTFTRNSLLKSAQHYWQKAGLGHWTIHSLRHTFGTTAGDAGLGVDAIRAGMGHDDRSSSAGYVHTDEITAAGVRSQIYGKLSGFLSGFVLKTQKTTKTKRTVKKEITCPECGHKHLVDIDL